MSRRNRPITELQKRCLIEATIDPLVVFRRGFARTKAGPFFSPNTVDGLVARGWLRVIKNRAGKYHLRLTARAA